MPRVKKIKVPNTTVAMNDYKTAFEVPDGAKSCQLFSDILTAMFKEFFTIQCLSPGWVCYSEHTNTTPEVHNWVVMTPWEIVEMDLYTPKDHVAFTLTGRLRGEDNMVYQFAVQAPPEQVSFTYGKGLQKGLTLDSEVKKSLILYKVLSSIPALKNHFSSARKKALRQFVDTEP